MKPEPIPGARLTLPFGLTLLQGRPYVNAASTDIRATFAALKASQAGPKSKRAPKLVSAR